MKCLLPEVPFLKRGQSSHDLACKSRALGSDEQGGEVTSSKWEITWHRNKMQSTAMIWYYLAASVVVTDRKSLLFPAWEIFQTCVYQCLTVYPSSCPVIIVDDTTHQMATFMSYRAFLWSCHRIVSCLLNNSTGQWKMHLMTHPNIVWISRN
jgi:hypothetical protein